MKLNAKAAEDTSQFQATPKLSESTCGVLVVLDVLVLMTTIQVVQEVTLKVS